MQNKPVWKNAGPENKSAGFKDALNTGSSRNQVGCDFTKPEAQNNISNCRTAGLKKKKEEAHKMTGKGSSPDTCLFFLF